jgi:hypothetical protein
MSLGAESSAKMASQDSRCRGTTKAGKPCQAAATEGGLCFFHANPRKAAELGRLGGKKNRRTAYRDLEPLPPLESANAVREAVARLIADVYAGRLHPRTAAGLAPLMNLQLRAIEQTSLQDRLAKLEHLVGKLVPDSSVEEAVGRRKPPRRTAW